MSADAAPPEAMDEGVLNLVFAALADPVRRAILARLDGGAHTVSDLAEPFDISMQAVSRHIHVLVRAGLVAQQRSGRIATCRLDTGPIYAAALWIARYSKYWQTQFDTLALWLAEIEPGRAGKPTPQAISFQPGRKTMRDAATTEKLRGYQTQMKELRRQMHEALRAAPPEPVPDYEFAALEGPVRLSALFGDKDDLFVIHNMGRSCAYCTLWADGYNGLVPHLENRAAFVVSSPDEPDAQRRFAQSRGWRFRMVSHAGSSFAADMGFRGEHGFLPGVSVFRRNADGIARVSDAGLGPYDEFCALWHFLDMLPEGAGEWRPKFSYAA